MEMGGNRTRKFFLLFAVLITTSFPSWAGSKLSNHQRTANQNQCAGIFRTVQTIKHEKTYFKNLIANWPKSEVGSESIPNSFGISLSEPKRITKPTENIEVLGTNWYPDRRDFKIKLKLNSIVEEQIQKNFVSWDSFQEKFRDSVAAFKNYAEKNDIQEYAVFVPSRGSIQQGPIKSSHYFTGKAILEEGLRPKKIVKHNTELGDIKHVVFIDDGAYTGIQIRNTITNFMLGAEEPVELHLIIPYASEAAKKANFGPQNQLIASGNDPHWYDQVTIKRSADVFRDEILKNPDLIDRNLFLLVFEHKVPDDISTFPLKVTTSKGIFTNLPPKTVAGRPNPQYFPEFDLFGNSDIDSFKAHYKDRNNFVDIRDLIDAADNWNP